MTTKLLALAPAILLSTASAASAAPAGSAATHERAHAPTAPASAPASASATATTPMLADDGCPLPGNVGKGSHDRCDLRHRAQLAAAAAKGGPSK